MDLAFILSVVGLAAWLGVMAIAVALPLRPDVVKITKWLVIPREGARSVCALGNIFRGVVADRVCSCAGGE